VKIKPGVQMRTLSPQMLLAIIEADRILEGSLVVTSVSDGTHSSGSLHYVGLAADFRLPLEPLDFVAQLKESLGAEFDVVIEKDHVHVEYQPKVRAS
jgi:hypothetical protein